MTKYTEENREAFRKVFGLIDEQIDLVEEADNLAEKWAIYPDIPAYVRQYGRIAENWLKQKNLWDEVGETMELVSAGLPQAEINRRKPLGICLLVALNLIQ